MGPVAPRHVGSSQTRARTCVPCIGGQILNHYATREAQILSFKGIGCAYFSGVLKLLFNHILVDSGSISVWPFDSSQGSQCGLSGEQGQMMRVALGFLFEMLLFLTPASLPKTAFPGHPALVCFLVETEFATLFFWNLCGPIRLLRVHLIWDNRFIYTSDFSKKKCHFHADLHCNF